MPSGPHCFRQQQGMEANAAAGIKSPAPRRALQGLDCRTKGWLCQGIGYRQALYTSIRTNHSILSTLKMTGLSQSVQPVMRVPRCFIPGMSPP